MKFGRWRVALLASCLIGFIMGLCSTVWAGQRDLGGLTPQEALAYMQKTPNLYILDVSPADKFAEKHFTGAVNIPHAEVISRINEIPPNRPVIVHCRLGRTCVKTYPLLKKLRPDIPVIAFINGSPLIDEYNASLKK